MNTFSRISTFLKLDIALYLLAQVVQIYKYLDHIKFFYSKLSVLLLNTWKYLPQDFVLQVVYCIN